MSALELAAQRNQIERDILLLSARLEAMGSGMDGGLVDSEGFPIEDYGLVSDVRSTRRRIRGTRRGLARRRILFWNDDTHCISSRAPLGPRRRDEKA